MTAVVGDAGTGAGTGGPAVRGGGPLRAVLAAFRAGDGNLAEVAARTGLDREVVSAAVAHLVRLGRVRAERLGSGCPEGGCGTCPSPTGTVSGAGSGAGTGSGVGAMSAPGLGGCGSGDPSRRGPVLLSLVRRPAG